MAEYMTTKEVAAYLRINEKKIYALVAEGQLPASRISGKWLFPKHIIDQWVEQNTRYPAVGLMGALLDDVLIIQGSDDWLFSRTAGRYQATGSVPVVSASVGSVAGLSALTNGKAHLAGCHIGNDEIEKLTGRGEGYYLVNLFSREQGLMFDSGRLPGLTGFEQVVEQKLRFAGRQSLSGTHRLTMRLLEEAGLEYSALDVEGLYTSHLDVGVAIRSGEADVGMGTRLAAHQSGLDFVTQHTEPFKLVLPVSFASQPQVVRFMEFVLDELKKASSKGVEGYSFADLGRMETVGAIGD